MNSKVTLNPQVEECTPGSYKSGPLPAPAEPEPETRKMRSADIPIPATKYFKNRGRGLCEKEPGGQ